MRLILLCFLGLLSIALIVQQVVIPAYRSMQSLRTSSNLSTATHRAEVRTTHLPVEHGGVASADDLHGHGVLYFVPVGRQAILVRSLAEYYAQKFNIQIDLLPEVNLGPAACVPERNQCIAEEVIAAMVDAYPQIARNPESVMIALTDEDIFPKEMGWEFTYSFHSSRLGVVSTHRMDPAFWGGPPDNDLRLASTKQMLTKYIALQYFHLPESLDPTSDLFSPLTPNAGPDDIYESDLHSEDSANGRRGISFPCLFFTYSYKTHQVKAGQPLISDCQYQNFVSTSDEENFDTNLAWGVLKQRSMDLQLNSTPAIQLKRGYDSVYYPPTAFTFGWGANHSYDSWLSSDGMASLSYSHINYEDGGFSFLGRTDPGRGFSPGAIYESHESDSYGAQLKWVTDHYKLDYRDGSWSTFFPCDAIHKFCYWTGYQDAEGNSLRFDRGPNRELRQLTASDNQSITFQLDDHHRTIKAEATDGSHVSYEYNSAGCLARVHRTDGQETLYEYDPAHRMTSMSVIRRPGAEPEVVLTNKYDSRGWLIAQTLSGIGSFQFEYVGPVGDYSSHVKITTPAGDVLNIDIGKNFYLAHSQHVQFAAAARQ